MSDARGESGRHVAPASHANCVHPAHANSVHPAHVRLSEGVPSFGGMNSKDMHSGNSGIGGEPLGDWDGDLPEPTDADRRVEPASGPDEGDARVDASESAGMRTFLPAAGSGPAGSALGGSALVDSGPIDTGSVHSGPVDSGPVHIDCGDCVMRDIACGDCVVTVLLGPPRAELDAGEQRAIAVLAESGLVPPLRMAR